MDVNQGFAQVAEDQGAKFASDELLRRLSQDSEIKYIDNLSILFKATGTVIKLKIHATTCEFREGKGKLYLKSDSITLNGVFVAWYGWIDLKLFEGVGRLEFDEYRAAEWESVGKRLPEFRRPAA